MGWHGSINQLIDELMNQPTNQPIDRRHALYLVSQSYAYYEITQPPESVSRRDDLLVTATPMSGDPDLYLTLKEHLPFPDNGEWRGASGTG
jgi:hypothetical protein